MRGLPTWSKRRFAAQWRERGELDGDIRYVALGDSAAQGIGAISFEAGYVGGLAKLGEAHTGLTIRVVNLSVSGAKAADLIAHQLPLLAQLEADVVTCAVGGNDIRRFDPAAFEREMGQVVRSVPPHALVADVPCFYDGRAEQRSKVASEIVQRLADATGRTAIPLHRSTEARTRAQVRGDFAADFFHPNDRGYGVWTAAFEAAFLARLDVVVATRRA